jgi:hypothetical protein
MLLFVLYALFATQVVRQNGDDEEPQKEQGAIVFFNDKKVGGKGHTDNNAGHP